jgi:flagellar basal-body rod protein FlgC
MFDTLDIGASGLAAQRIRMDTIAGNVANMNATRSQNGGTEPYRRRFVVFAPSREAGTAAPGVRVDSVQLDRSAFQKRYEPGHPDAGEDGYVEYPNVDMTIEMVNMMDASRAYESNITLMETTKQMLNASLRLLA